MRHYPVQSQALTTVECGGGIGKAKGELVASDFERSELSGEGEVEARKVQGSVSHPAKLDHLDLRP